MKRKNLASVIIPTLDEEKAIRKVLVDMPMETVDEVIVVDNSTDFTANIAKDLGTKVIPEPRAGYGRALQTGIENANGDIVVYIDGDYTYDPKEIPQMIHLILSGQYDIVLGSRIKGRMLHRSMSVKNRFGNLVLSLFFNILFFKKISDTQSGFRAIKKHLLDGLTCREHGMPYVTEQLIKLIKRDARIGEIPVTYRPREGETKLSPWSDGFKILKTLIKGRFID